MASTPPAGQQQPSPEPSLAELADRMYAAAVKLHKGRHWDESVEAYRLAAEAGHKNAAHNLAVMLRYLSKPEEAAIWWKQAGHKTEQRMIEPFRGLRPEKKSTQSVKRTRGR